MKYCPNCGTSMEDMVGFCPQCGKEMNGSATEESTSTLTKVAVGGTDKKKKTIIFLCIFVLVAVLAVVLVILFGELESEEEVWQGPSGTYVFMAENIEMGTLTFYRDRVISEMFGNRKEGDWKYENGIVVLSFPGGTGDTYLYDVNLDKLTHTSIDLFVFYKR